MRTKDCCKYYKLQGAPIPGGWNAVERRHIGVKVSQPHRLVQKLAWVSHTARIIVQIQRMAIAIVNTKAEVVVGGRNCRLVVTT
jgi:hypothetical protein